MMSYSHRSKRYYSPYGRESYMRNRARYRRKAIAYGSRRSSLYSNPRYFQPGLDRTSGFYRPGGYGTGRNKDAELKFHDDNLDENAIPVGGTVHVLAHGVIPENTNPDGRIGRKITLKSWEWRWTLTLPEVAKSTTPENGDSVRMIVFLDKQTNGAQAATADVLVGASTESMYNLTNLSRFVILYDKYVTLNYSGIASEVADTVSQIQVIRVGHWSKKCNIPIEYSGTAGTIGEIRSNGLNVLLLTLNGIMNITSITRGRYSDA